MRVITNMVTYGCCGPELKNSDLKMDVLGAWLESDWMLRHAEQKPVSLVVSNAVVDLSVLAKYVPDFPLAHGYHFAGTEAVDCSAALRVNDLNYDGTLTHQMGAAVYRFAKDEQTVEVMVVAAYFANQAYDCYVVTLAAVPEAFIPVWHGFASECNRLAYALEPTQRVVIIGGNAQSFVPTVDWDEIVLPSKLKEDILDDVRSFFSKGIDIYRRLNLKPFRKLLLAGVPGTGKTMICSALAKWALDHNYLVIYVSSALKKQGDAYGSTFGKIEHALSVAAYSAHPALILLEELDAYLHPEEKALVLNVLDGNESSINDKGTLLVATTNYPEAIDERVLKRPGRLDRIFIIPETKVQADAEQMLRRYLGAMWHDDHRALVPALVGYPGAFIREVAVCALTQVAYDDLTELSYELLERSFVGLKDQLEARDEFLNKRNGARADLPVNVN